MTGQYQVRLYNTAGNLQAVFDNPNSIYYFKRINDFSYHIISIPSTDPRRALFTTDAILEVWRRAPGIDWYIDYDGFHRTDQDQFTDPGLQNFTSYGRGFMDLLHRRSIAWFAGTSQDTKTGFADDVAKAYVRENCGSLALAASGRLRDGAIPGFTVAANTSSAPSWSGSNAFENVLSVLQQITAAVPFDFTVTRTPPTTWLFQTYYPRLGVDRTGAGAAAPVIFSLSHGNMSSPYAVMTRTDEVNAVIALGQGEGVNRNFAVRTDPFAIALSPWNDAEKTHDARNISDATALAQSADAELALLRATRHISFVNLESTGTMYGLDYNLGDLVVASFAGFQQTKKVIGIEVTVSQGKETIRMHFDDENVVPSP